jgi:N-acetylglucosaminyldiphosphoundecaprenol N-acetyl-beta-D-mannosaminyltransferase
VTKISAIENLKRVDILGVDIHPVDTRTLTAQVAAWIDARHAGNTAVCRQICTVNPEFVIDARRSPDFARVLAQADLCVADGVGILLAGRLLQTPFPERVTGSDGIYTLCAAAAQRGQRVFFLGAGPGVAKKTAEILRARYPQLQVAGWYSGSPADDEWPTIAQQLHAAAPDLLFVAYGHPRQDFWIHRHRHELPVAVAMGIGGAFDFVAGVSKRAPRVWQRLGLEWLYRLLREPWRWRRMRKLPLFALLVLKQWWSSRLSYNRKL